MYYNVDDYDDKCSFVQQASFYQNGFYFWCRRQLNQDVFIIMGLFLTDDDLHAITLLFCTSHEDDNLIQ